VTPVKSSLVSSTGTRPIKAISSPGESGVAISTFPPEIPCARIAGTRVRLRQYKTWGIDRKAATKQKQSAGNLIFRNHLFRSGELSLFVNLGLVDSSSATSTTHIFFNRIRAKFIGYAVNSKVVNS
jgi:hypothetical protein